ncbi:hypothetical protein L6452_26699 [Arctium lappa]|uniref:Uncharacterized protein n=1 Tax=Arctium lappa TaxID=4217 RepID=A0ACB8ZWH4_ARCLA|nr:hypothetical protein L6452_26699 [Arctium lappa]
MNRTLVIKFDNNNSHCSPLLQSQGGEEIYNIAEMDESSLVDKTIEFTSSSILGETMKSGTTSATSDAAAKEESEGYNPETMGMSKAFVSDKTTESASIPHDVKSKSVVTNKVSRKIVLKVNVTSDTEKRKVLKKVSGLAGIESIALDLKEGNLTVTGDVDPVEVVMRVRKIGLYVEIISVGPSKEHKTGVVLAKEPPKEHKTGVVFAKETPKELKIAQEPFFTYEPTPGDVDKSCSLM